MSTIVTRKVIDLPDASRRMIEQMLGQPLGFDQRVHIIVDALYSATPKGKRASADRRHHRRP